MDFISLLSANALSNAIGDLIYKYLYGWIQTWSDNWTVIGAFSVTTIMFTVFLKVLVSPLEIWQKSVMRKNAKKMEIMRPELEKIQKQCGSNKELLAQKQRELYKKNKYSMFGSCLPLIVTMAVFFIVFAGFNSAVATHSAETYNGLEKEFDTVYAREIASDKYDGMTIDEKNDACIKVAADAVVEKYDTEYKESFIWVKNIFVGDNWKSPVMSASDISKNVSGVRESKYEMVMSSLSEKYSGWNGYLILPLLVLGLNVVSIFINKPQTEQQQQASMAVGQTEEQQKAQQSQAKIMQYIMPVMMFVFALFYSAAFTLYMFVNMLFSIVLNLVYNIVTKKKDDAEKAHKMATTPMKK